MDRPVHNTETLFGKQTNIWSTVLVHYGFFIKTHNIPLTWLNGNLTEKKNSKSITLHQILNKELTYQIENKPKKQTKNECIKTLQWVLGLGTRSRLLFKKNKLVLRCSQWTINYFNTVLTYTCSIFQWRYNTQSKKLFYLDSVLTVQLLQLKDVLIFHHQKPRENKISICP